MIENNRITAALPCLSCGAALHDDLICLYCGTRYGYVVQYIGPQIDNEIWPMKDNVSVMNFQGFYVTSASYYG